MKKCARCGELKVHSAFRKNSQLKSGLHSYCLNCDKKIKMNYKKSARGREMNSIWEKSEKARSAQQKYRSSEKAKNNVRNRHLKRVFGITQDEYLKMLSSQNERCAICEKHYSYQNRRLDIDHDHETGKIRGLLCNPCNRAIGRFEHNTMLMKKAINYLKGELL